MRKTESFRRSYSYLKTLDVSKTEDPVYLSGYFSECVRTFEMAWKAMQEILAERDVEFQRGAPRRVLEVAFQHGLIENSALWSEMYDLRNLNVHTYNSRVAERFLAALPEILSAFQSFLEQLEEIETAAFGSRTKQSDTDPQCRTNCPTDRD